ncbi:hypothetical protein V6N12_003934 [Hibiscus sabdariffa]|uniref:RNase H type-1 domain-containing protein n=1 Tax=Hibiscus sabdariffa TaxID=183260 RepID=A0ABR2CJY1_9ROSI
MLFALDLGFYYIEMESDSKTIITKINSQHCDLSEVDGRGKSSGNLIEFEITSSENHIIRKPISRWQLV